MSNTGHRMVKLGLILVTRQPSMGLSSVMTIILVLIMGIRRPTEPDVEHITVTLGLIPDIRPLLWAFHRLSRPS